MHLRTRFPTHLALAVCWLALFSIPGCSSDGEPNSTRDTSIGALPDGRIPFRFETFTAIENPSNNLSRIVDWRTSRPATASIRATCDDQTVANFAIEESRAEHRAFVMGFWEGAACEISVEAETRTGITASKTTNVVVGSLPEFLPDLEASVTLLDRRQPGWTVVNLNNSFDDIPLIIAVIDAEGRYRWYHQRESSGSGAATSVTPVDGGFLVGGTSDSGRVWPAVVEWTGDLAWEGRIEMHHDIRPWKQDSVLYLGRAEECDIDRAGGSTAVIRYDRSSQSEIWRWELCDHWAPQNPGPDWDHTNAIEPFPGNEALLTSPRTQSALFKFDIDTGELQWRLGKDGDFERSSDSSEPAFLRQHAPEIQPDGNILLFDNGSESRPYSRAVEISYDTDEMTYQTEWVYRPEPDRFAPIWGDADRLDNGNTLVAFGRRDREKGSILQEVTPNETVVWELRTPNKWGWYRAERIPEPPGGFALEPGE